MINRFNKKNVNFPQNNSNILAFCQDHEYDSYDFENGLFMTLDDYLFWLDYEKKTHNEDVHMELREKLTKKNRWVDECYNDGGCVRVLTMGKQFDYHLPDDLKEFYNSQLQLKPQIIIKDDWYWTSDHNIVDPVLSSSCQSFSPFESALDEWLQIIHDPRGPNCCGSVMINAKKDSKFFGKLLFFYDADDGMLSAPNFTLTEFFEYLVEFPHVLDYKESFGHHFVQYDEQTLKWLKHSRERKTAVLHNIAISMFPQVGCIIQSFIGMDPIYTKVCWRKW